MAEVEIRPLNDDEIPESRRLYARNPDAHARYVAERLPNFFEIAEAFDTRTSYLARQRLALGAFTKGCMVGTVAVERVGTQTERELGPDEWGHLLTRFPEHDLNVYYTLHSAFCKTFIGAPNGSLSVHSLSVDTPHRRNGVANRLIAEAIRKLNADERSSLYIEIARIKWLQRLCETLGFRVVRKRFSVSERLEFGCWGSVLMEHVT